MCWARGGRRLQHVHSPWAALWPRGQLAACRWVVVLRAQWCGAECAPRTGLPVCVATTSAVRGDGTGCGGARLHGMHTGKGGLSGAVRTHRSATTVRAAGSTPAVLAEHRCQCCGIGATCIRPRALPPASLPATHATTAAVNSKGAAAITDNTTTEAGCRTHHNTTTDTGVHQQSAHKQFWHERHARRSRRLPGRAYWVCDAGWGIPGSSA